MSAGVKAGRSNFLHYNDDYVADPVAGYATPDWVVIDRIGDLDRTNSKNATEVDMRASDTTIVVYGNKNREISFTYYKRQGATDAVFNKLLDSFENAKPMDIRIGETAPTVVGGLFDRGPFTVSEMTKAEPIAGVDTYEIKMNVADALSAAGVAYLYQTNLVVPPL
jgi:hypothetical protein